MGSSRRAERFISLLVAPRRARRKWTCRTGDDDTIIITIITIGDTVAGTARDVGDTTTTGGVDIVAVAGRGTTGAVTIIAVAVSLTVATTDTVGVVDSMFFVQLPTPQSRDHGIEPSLLSPQERRAGG